MVLETATWYRTPSVESIKLSFAGMWYGYLSLPIFQFLFCRWYFRLGIWVHFLWQVSRIKLDLVPAHPDGNAGLGFLSNITYAFRFLAVGHGALLSGLMANRIFVSGKNCRISRVEIAILVVSLDVRDLRAPSLLFFSTAGPLQAYRTGNIDIWYLAAVYVCAFHAKWLRGGAAADEPLIGSSDIQSLADLGNSLQVIRNMRIIPVSRDAILQLIAAILLPIVPLVLTMMPLEELMSRMLGMLF